MPRNNASEPRRVKLTETASFAWLLARDFSYGQGILRWVLAIGTWPMHALEMLSAVALHQGWTDSNGNAYLRVYRTGTGWKSLLVVAPVLLSVVVASWIALAFGFVELSYCVVSVAVVCIASALGVRELNHRNRALGLTRQARKRDRQVLSESTWAVTALASRRTGAGISLIRPVLQEIGVAGDTFAARASSEKVAEIYRRRLDAERPTGSGLAVRGQLHRD